MIERERVKGEGVKVKRRIWSEERGNRGEQSNFFPLLPSKLLSSVQALSVLYVGPCPF